MDNMGDCSWEFTKFFMFILELSSYFMPYFVCLFVQVSVNGVQLYSLVEVSRCEPLSHSGGGNEPCRFVLYELLPFFVGCKRGSSKGLVDRSL